MRKSRLWKYFRIGDFRVWIFKVRKAINKYESLNGRLPKSGRVPAKVFDALYAEMKNLMRFSRDWELSKDYIKFMNVILKKDETVKDCVVFEGKK
jgi:hypothetical protein